MSLLLSGPMLKLPSAGGSLSAVTYVSNADLNNAGTTTYTFSSQSIGTADADRWVFVGVAIEKSSTQTIDSMTIGGTSATMSTDQALYGGGGVRWGWANITSGTTADIVVTVSATNVDFCGIVVYNVTHGGTPSVTEAKAETLQVASINLNINTTGGALLAYAHCYMGSAPRTWSWTGPTEDVDWSDATEVYNVQSAASTYPTTTQTPMTVTATAAGSPSNNNYNMVGMSLHIT